MILEETSCLFVGNQGRKAFQTAFQLNLRIMSRQEHRRFFERTGVGCSLKSESLNGFGIHDVSSHEGALRAYGRGSAITCASGPKFRNSLRTYPPSVPLPPVTRIWNVHAERHANLVPGNDSLVEECLGKKHLVCRHRTRLSCCFGRRKVLHMAST